MLGGVTDLRLSPTAMVPGGHALARDADGRVVLVEGALPGEEVLARVVDERRDFARAVAVEVLEASPDRISPPCPALAAGCGGCTWQHIRPEAQVRFKDAIVLDALRRIARIEDPPALLVWPLRGPALRTTARLAVTPSGRAGHRPAGSAETAAREAVPTHACFVVHPLLEELVVAGRYPGAGEVLLRVGVASGERVVRVDRPGAAGQVRVPTGVEVIGLGDGRPGAVHEEIAGRRLRISADSFFQPGPVVAAALADAVDDAVGDALPAGGHLLDAYAGVGLFAAVLGSRRPGVRVTVVERDPAAVADAAVNLADVDARILSREVARWRPRRGDCVDVVVADPSRTGLGRPGVEAVVAAGGSRIVLVSCDPASFARDARLLNQSGYRLLSIRTVEAFPHTFHTETVSTFDR